MASLVDVHLDGSPYSADLIQGNKPNPFLAISGAKKGSKRKGGGIIVADLRSLDSFLNLIGVIGFLELPADPKEERVAFSSEKTRFLSGETKLFDNKWFFRVKVYQNFFRDAETGSYVSMRQHELRPAGFRFFIQEMDFPINEQGKLFAQTFIARIYESIKESLHRLFLNGEEDLVELTRQWKILVGGELPWITGEGQTKATYLPEPLLDTVCQCLMDDPYTDQSLAAKFHINPSLAATFTNPSVRYAPEFLARGIAVDRLRGLHSNIQYQATKIPQKALQQSPMLTDLLDEKAGEDWPSWKKVTFSNDQYPQGRPASLSYAKFEVEAFCGGRAWGVPVDINKARATALRLFDLKRYFEKQKEGLDDVRELSKRFTSAVLKD
jgi:hypothetical protein